MQSDRQSFQDTLEFEYENCAMCNQPAAGMGPFSRMHLCRLHLNVDVADAQNLKQVVDGELAAYTQDIVGFESASSLEKQLEEIQQRFDAVQRNVDEFRGRLIGDMTGRLEAARIWQRDVEDIASYKREVTVATAANKMAKVVNLAETMQASLSKRQEIFVKVKKLSTASHGWKAQVQRLEKLERLAGCAAAGVDIADSASESASSSETEVLIRQKRCRTGYEPVTVRNRPSDASTLSSFSVSHEVKLEGWVHWLTVCSDTSGFVGNSSGFVTTAESGDEGSVALPQPCVFAIFSDKDYLTAMSVDGSEKFKCKCFITCKNLAWGLRCERQLLFIAQPEAVTVTDLSGRIKARIQPDIINFGDIWGIGSSAEYIFVSSGNKIAAFNLSNFELQTIITIAELPDADFCNIACYDDCILVADKYHNKVHKVCVETQMLLSSYPIKHLGSSHFAYPYDVAVDSRGRLFVTEFRRHTVRAVTVDSGSPLWSLDSSGDIDTDKKKLCCPCGLAVLTDADYGERLLVADRNNQRLLVLNLD